MSHLIERFANAVAVLVDDRPVKQRLVDAFVNHLEDVKDAELPADLRDAFRNLQTAVTRVAPLGNESRVRATVQKMSAREAADHAVVIARLHGRLCSHAERAEPLKVVSQAEKPPRYLAQRP